MILKSLRHISLKWFYLVLILNFIVSLQQCAGEIAADQKNVIQISVQSQTTGKEYNLKLTKADKFSVQHNDIKVISTALTLPNETYGKADKIWTSSRNSEHENLYIDLENLAVVRLAYNNEKKEYYLKGGIVNGNQLVKKSESDQIANIIDDEVSTQRNQSDYLDLGRKITPSKTRNGNGPVFAELVIVCDKEFGDKFNHDHQAILDYWTVYFWDINMRFRTLPNVEISFQINSIVVLSTPSEQPFIEQSRASDGRIEFIRVIDRFSKWVYSKQNTLPKFDLAIAVTNTQVEWDGGYALYNSACWVDDRREMFLGTAVWNDAGDWSSLGVGAHELAHILGARHDDDPNHPGGQCDSRGYIMMGRIGDKKWFFSECSDRTIREFVHSDKASCLKRLDESPADFKAAIGTYRRIGIEAPSMDEQCKRKLNNENAFAKEEDAGDCELIKCWVPQDNGGWLIWSKWPVDNTPCRGGGKCFRGRCRGIGKLLMNVGSYKCAIADNPFYHQVPLKMKDCPILTDTPLEQFVVEEGFGENGKYFLTPWNTKDGNENGDRCLYTGGWEGDGVWTDRCDKGNSWQGWEMERVEGDNEYIEYFLLRHKVTGRCAKDKGNWVGSYDCDKNDKSMWWALLGDELFTPVPVISTG